jgi:hypothetical protein
VTETIVLDSTAIATGRTQLDITPWVSSEGVDWGDAAITSFMADAQMGSTVVDYRVPNRTVKIPLNLRAVGATSFATIRQQVQAKAALMQAEGGWIMRQIDSTPLYADVMNATLHLGGSWLAAYRSADTDAVLTIECLPDFYGDEIALSDHVETTLPQLIFTEPLINGNYPGRVRMVVDNDQATDQHGLLWGYRSRYYSGTATAALALECESLTPINGSGGTALAGASGGSAISNFSMPYLTWVPILQTNIATGNKPLEHKGSYRAWIRAWSNAQRPSLRLVWGVGSLSNPTTNDPVQLPGSGAFYLLDLGVIRLDPALAGTHSWYGVIQCYGTGGNDPIHLDELLFQPLDDGAGQLVAGAPTAPTWCNYERNPSAGADNAGIGTVAWTSPGSIVIGAGGNPTAVIGAGGAATHYLFATGFGFAIPASATIVGIACWMWHASTNANYAADLNIRLLKAGALTGTNMARTTTWWANYWETVWYPQNVSGGGPGNLWGTTWTPTDINASNFGIAFSATTGTGTGTLYLGALGLQVQFTLPGGFAVAQDAVLYASKTAELRTEGCWRSDANNVYGRESNVLGDLPRLPPSGLEGRTLQVFLKESRGNLANEPDAGIDDMSCRLYYRPSYLITP